MQYTRGRKATLLLTFAFIIIYVFSLVFIVRNHEKEIRDYIAVRDTLYVNSYENTISSYERFSNYIFYSRINQDTILRMMSQANASNESQRAQIRNQLYDFLKAEYLLTQEYNFRQLHFHLPNGDSFLRFHSPERFGDNLFSVRESIRRANTEETYVSGFEEGRIINGYRFVYPLSFEGKHVGTVEVSISMMSILEDLSRSELPRDMGFILDRQVMSDTVFIEEQGRYEISPISEHFVTDTEIDALMAQSPFQINIMQNEKAREKLKPVICDQINDMQSFSGWVIVENNAYLTQFYAIEDISGRPVAYLYSISESRVIYDLHIQRNLLIIFATVAVIIIFILLLYIARTQRKISDLAMHDPLTKTYNRRVFFDYANKLLAQQHRDHSEFCVAMLDIDHFKKVNDTFGHNVGDITLVELARLISGSIRSTDLFARFGGEEFILLLPQTNKDMAYEVLERIRNKVESYDFTKVGHITISAGISEIAETDIFEEAISRSDQALYMAKSTGRNKVVVYSEDKVLE